MTKSSVCCTPCLRNHTHMIVIYMVHLWKMMISPGILFIFKFWFSGFLTKWQKILSHFLSQKLHLMWLCFWYTCVKWWYLQHFFFFFLFSFFQNSDFSGFSKFINRCQMEILKFAQPSHVCDIFLKECF